jgi:hypothetical protein
MVTWSSSVQGFQTLGDFSQVTAKTESPSFLLRWSDDGETVSFGDDFTLTIKKFRCLDKHFFSRAEEPCNDLMLDLSLRLILFKSKKPWRIRTAALRSFSILLINSRMQIEISTKACTTRRAACSGRIDGTGKLSLFTREGRAASWNACWRTSKEWSPRCASVRAD